MKKDNILDAVAALKSGEIVVYPTDTLYAIGADIFNIEGVKKVFNIKKRPFSNPLPVAVADYSTIGDIAYIDDIVKKVVEHFLPGSLTVILKKKDIVSNFITGNLDKIAVRIPNNKIALNLLLTYGRPLTVTSANIHKEKTPCVINDIMMQFNREVSVYLDDGRLDGKPSTIVDLTLEKPRIVREGTISLKDILDAI